MASNEKEEEDNFDGYDHDSDEGYNHMVNNLSRLSMCTSSVYTNEDIDDFDGGTRMMSMSRLSIEGGFEADNESDEKEGMVDTVFDMITWDSDKEQSGCFSLPTTPPRRRRSQSGGLMLTNNYMEYESENEAQKGVTIQENTRKSWSDSRARRKRVGREGSDKRRAVGKEDYGYSNSFSGESEGGGGGGGSSGVVVITRPKGGKRALCMDLEEVKACRDLGFELEHERMLEINNSFVSISGSTLDTSSGGNSPIANWRISSPGDDPRDVKARLKVWAQAVALASTSRHGGS